MFGIVWETQIEHLYQLASTMLSEEEGHKEGNDEEGVSEGEALVKEQKTLSPFVVCIPNGISLEYQISVCHN